MLARWYVLLGQFSVTFEYRLGSQHANADGLSRQCGQCLWPDCPVAPPDVGVVKTGSTSELEEQPFAESVMGDSMDSDLLPELLCETWVDATHLDEATGDLPPSGLEPDLITSSLKTLTIVREWVRAGSPPPRFISGAAFVASPVRQLVNPFGRSSVASPYTPGDGATAGGAIWRASGVHSPIS